MDNNLKAKVDRLNELYVKAESGTPLNNLELNEQAFLRDELINYFKFAVSKLSNKS